MVVEEQRVKRRERSVDHGHAADDSAVCYVVGNNGQRLRTDHRTPRRLVNSRDCDCETVRLCHHAPSYCSYTHASHQAAPLGRGLGGLGALNTHAQGLRCGVGMGASQGLDH